MTRKKKDMQVQGQTPGKSVEDDMLLDVERSEAARQADRWAVLNQDIESKKALLVTQTETVMQAMKALKQRTLTITDEMGYKHTFAIINAGEKLKHSKREEN